MNVVSNASPLIALARIGHLDLLHDMFDVVFISSEVHNEVVVAGAGMPGADAVSKAGWILVSAVQGRDVLVNSIGRTGLGAGETSAVQLAKELAIGVVLMDEWRGRRLAKEVGLAVVGCVGILEELYRRGNLADLRGAYVALLNNNIRISLAILQSSLKRFEFPPL